MRINKILQGNYKSCEAYYQLKLPIDISHDIPADDPVRLLSTFVEGLELTDLYSTYERIRKNQATPRQMLKILIYAYMNHIYSSRAIETSCRRDMNFMYLLEGSPAPDHATIARFRTLHFSQCHKTILASMTGVLLDLGEISGQVIFIDGTKIEANANKYTFVWKKGVLKNQAKLTSHLPEFVAECEELYGITIVHHDQISLHTLKRLRKKLYRLKKEEEISFVYGSGKRKPNLQRSMEQTEKYISRLQEYSKKIHVCGPRNSYSKTDPDATFMRMKEDYMMNGQLKPGYNVQHGVDSEYVTWLNVSWHPADSRTLIPFIKDMEQHLGFKYRDIVADSGYEGEENYCFIEENGQEAYIKPNNYEISKTRKYKTDISRRENMQYDAGSDCYTCRNGKQLRATLERRTKTDSGYPKTVTTYECQDCTGCPYKSQCIRGNNCNTPMEQRNKHLAVSKVLEEKRKADLERILSDYGTRLRMNRSIQAEGSFADVKEDMGFRQYLCRGNTNVLAESILLAMAHNMNKLHNRIQKKRTGQHLFKLRKSA